MQVRRYHALLAAGTLVLAALILSCQHEAQAQQIVLSNARGLDFGRFVAGTGGTVILSPTGVRSRTGGVILLNSSTAGQAMFNVGKSSNGGNNKAVIISLPANGSTRLNSGANSMAVNTFVNNPGSLASVPSGGTTLSVGATLVVAPNQPPGNYTGSFPLTVNFQ
ncbi:DUF4402 domain-containing protein [Telluria aromaticivorans]|uniref:DUF4402 domain-containing protein n=1 Tax=Telluria aromaticivorans TaxID=2725995 RepID=A0A7Y2K060_9BURK|nr:DUF4402 domain-containing protein [Telluria aromaticivorans]NNG22999.1 DUF4402 domain-containing protein [Telluria aromaticivorans]